MTCFCFVFFLNHGEIFFFFLFFSYVIQFTAQNGNAHILGSVMLLRTCKLSIQQSEKRCFPMSLSSLPSQNISVRLWGLYERSSFFKCGLFPSRVSISVTIWGVIWVKICKEQEEKEVSLKYHFDLLNQTANDSRGRRSTRKAPRFSSSWSVVETPRSTELTPSLRRHQAEKREKNIKSEEY